MKSLRSLFIVRRFYKYLIVVGLVFNLHQEVSAEVDKEKKEQNIPQEKFYGGIDTKDFSQLNDSVRWHANTIIDLEKLKLLNGQRFEKALEIVRKEGFDIYFFKDLSPKNDDDLERIIELSQKDPRNNQNAIKIDKELFANITSFLNFESTYNHLYNHKSIGIVIHPDDLGLHIKNGDNPNLDIEFKFFVSRFKKPVIVLPETATVNELFYLYALSLVQSSSYAKKLNSILASDLPQILLGDVKKEYLKIVPKDNKILDANVALPTLLVGINAKSNNDDDLDFVIKFIKYRFQILYIQYHITQSSTIFSLFDFFNSHANELDIIKSPNFSKFFSIYSSQSLGLITAEINSSTVIANNLIIKKHRSLNFAQTLMYSQIFLNVNKLFLHMKNECELLIKYFKEVTNTFRIRF